MVLYAVVDVTKDGPDAVLVLDVQLQIANHAEVLDQAGHGAVEAPEASPLHHGVLVGRVGYPHVLVLGAAALGLLALGLAARDLGGVVVEQGDVGREEALEVLPADLVLDEVHLGQDVEVGDLEHDHGAHGAQGAGEELGAVDDERGLEQVGGAEADVEGPRPRQELHERRQDRHVRVQLDLARHVDDDEVLLGERLERVRQEVQVLHQELEAVDQPAVGAQPHLLHHVLQGDQFPDVQVRRVLERLRRRVQVDVEARAPVQLQVRYEGRAEGRLHGSKRGNGMVSEIISERKRDKKKRESNYAHSVNNKV